jgi:hypothetical protein
MKIYVAGVEALRKKEREVKTGWSQFVIKIDGFFEFQNPPYLPFWMVIFFFPVLFLEIHPVYDQTQGSGVVFSLLYGTSNG